MIYHVTSRVDWQAAQSSGVYVLSTRGQSLTDVGFIHCSDAHQVAAVANAFYAGVRDLVILSIDTARLSVEVRYEGDREQFPHIYGPLPVDAVIAVDPLQANADGRFVYPG